ncbi:hypothetical protein B0H11DRAFT_2220131 [Mycena galericulata]|nr:hypothetical protein B0H11DRAFT_2220131 [Mycena galericulata]
METVYHVGTVTNFVIVMRDGITWVALNCDPGCIPGDAWDSVDRVWYYSHKHPTDKNRFFKSGEWSKIADWQHIDRYWTEWIPTVQQTSPDPLPWYHIEDDPTAIKKTQYNQFLIEVAVRDKLVEGLKEAWDVVVALTSSTPFPIGSPIPIEANYNEFYFAKDSSKEAFKLLAAAKRKMLELLGMINWWTLINPFWENLCGVILNLARDHPVINLPILLKHNVPVIFPKLAPLLLNAYWKKKKVVKADFLVADEDFFKSEDYDYLFKYSIMLESYPPNDVEAPKIPPKKLKESWTYFMIDSEGYGRRPVIDRGWQLYYAYRYHYEILGDTESEEATVIFYRIYRKEDNKVERYITEGSNYDPDEDVYDDSTSDDDPTPSDSTRDALNNDFLVRELSHIKYAPRPGQHFDKKTGLELERPWSGSNVLAKWSAELLKAVPTSPDSVEFTRTREAIKRVVKIIEEEVPERMEVNENPDASASGHPPAYTISPEVLETPARPKAKSESNIQGIRSKGTSNIEPDFIALPQISLLEHMMDAGMLTSRPIWATPEFQNAFVDVASF